MQSVHVVPNSTEGNKKKTVVVLAEKAVVVLAKKTVVMLAENWSYLPKTGRVGQKKVTQLFHEVLYFLLT